MKRSRLILSIAFFFTLALAACGGRAPDTPTPPPPESVLTAAAQTAQAGLTESAAPLAATETPLPATPTAASTLSPGPAESPTPVATAAPTEPAPQGGSDVAQFVADVTVPDGTSFAPGTSFTKTWRLSNAGTSTWTSDYALVFLNGERMGAPDSVALPGTVAPGETVDLSIEMTAPNQAGRYTGFWILRNPSGQTFQTSFYVDINVNGGGSGVTQTPGASPTASGSGPVTSASLQVDDADVTDTCPHTFNFTAQVTTSSATQITIQLEAGADDPTYTFNLPGLQTYNVGAGTFTYSYSLALQDSVNGWARLRVASPNVVNSNQVNFSLTCQ